MPPMFTTDKANEEFNAGFATPARAQLSGEIANSHTVYDTLGRLWAVTQRSLEQLPPGEAHQPAADTDLARDLKDAVHATLMDLWGELKPKVAAPGAEPFTLRHRATSVEQAYGAAYRGALAHAAAAADRAAASMFVGLPAAQNQHTIHSPPGLGPDHAPTTDPQPDIVDLICQRMTADGATPAVQGTATDTQGNDLAAPAQRAAAVPPTLARAATRLTSIGCPPLRVDPIAGTLATHILQSKPTFTDWVESKNLTGASLREGMTDARALDLATQQFGPVFLISNPAEVLLRRLLSVVLASKMGNWKLSTFLEEIPGEGALAELPDSILKGLSERLKLEMKLEQLAGAKH